jgi:hypothetical protein
MPWAKHDLIFWFAAAALFQIYFIARYQLVHWVWADVRRARYATALRRAKLFSWLPGFSKALIGEIWHESDRQNEAESLLKQPAFDSAGSPRLTSPDLCAYAQVVAAKGNVQEANNLLEAAVLVPQKSGAVQMALRNCYWKEGRRPPGPEI